MASRLFPRLRSPRNRLRFSNRADTRSVALRLAGRCSVHHQTRKHLPKIILAGPNHVLFPANLFIGIRLNMRIVTRHFLFYGQN